MSDTGALYDNSSCWTSVGGLGWSAPISRRFHSAQVELEQTSCQSQSSCMDVCSFKPGTCSPGLQGPQRAHTQVHTGVEVETPLWSVPQASRGMASLAWLCFIGTDWKMDGWLLIHDYFDTLFWLHTQAVLNSGVAVEPSIEWYRVQSLLYLSNSFVACCNVLIQSRLCLNKRKL